ncbi:MAG TPA: DUF6452 family protein [Flavobacteriaceae bacterium]|nr:DUF6452 family protein [Flavobacteriaceae bacterium]
MNKNCLFFVLLISILAVSCQKDDICPETAETTPMLIIRFYDFEDQTKLKKAIGLNLIAEGQTDSLFTDAQTTDSIAIPLKTFQNYTHYQFIVHIGEEPNTQLPTNADTLQFSYFPEEEYLNKACGFKTEFLDFNALKVSEPNGENWIKNIIVEQTKIENETGAHLSIFH